MKRIQGFDSRSPRGFSAMRSFCNGDSVRIKGSVRVSQIENRGFQCKKGFRKWEKISLGSAMVIFVATDTGFSYGDVVAADTGFSGFDYAAREIW
ncbi:hypothetical protein U1Q18_020328 [Sarracenia purpurea var. burkii]